MFANNRQENKRNNDELCDWIGPWADLQKHVNHCPLHMVYCYHCHQGMMRKDFDEQAHFAICNKYPIPCKWCKLRIARDMMQDHILNECSLQMIKCDWCNERMIRWKLSKHICSECPEVMISCAYKKYGCNQMIKRKEMAQHIESEMGKHLEFVEQCHKKLEGKVGDLKKQIVDLTEDREVMEQTIDELKCEHEELKDEYQDQIDDLQLQVNGLFDVVVHIQNQR